MSSENLSPAVIAIHRWAAPGEPEEVATCFVFLASDGPSYITDQVLHPNGGRVVNG